jgi:hypothetical protein
MLFEILCGFTGRGQGSPGTLRRIVADSDTAAFELLRFVVAVDEREKKHE